MNPNFDFTILKGFEQSENARHNAYEAPEYLIPIKVHSIQSEGVSNADCLTSNPNKSPSLEEPSTGCTLTRTTQEEQQAPSIILDYGVAVAGIPILKVISLESSSSRSSTKNLPIILDISFSEGYPGILRTDGDGPFPFSAGADTLRRVRFRISNPGYHEARQVQGSQRCMKVTLTSTKPCRIVLSLVGFKPTTSNIPVDKLPGFFECSDQRLSELWGYGARTLQLNCVPPRTVSPPWQVSEDTGVLIDSQRCNAYGWGGDWTDYRLKVDGMIIHEGLAWNVRVNGGAPGLIFQICLRENEVPVLEMWYGYYDKPQTTLIPMFLDSKEITGLGVVTRKWYTIETVCIGDEPISVYTDSILVGTFEQGSGEKSQRIDLGGKAKLAPKTPKGSIGLGAGQDQVCRFKDMKVTAEPSQEILYSSGLNNPAVLADFGIGWNQLPYIFDGAKRDRYAWTADIITGGPSLYYSIAASEHIRGNIEASMLRSQSGRQQTSLVSGSKSHSALLPGGVPPGREFERDPADTMFNVLSVNYSLYLIMVLYDYWMYTGEDNFVKRCCDPVRQCLEYIEGLVNENGLVQAEGMEARDYDYYNGLQTGVSTKRNALYISTLRKCAKMVSKVLNDEDQATKYLSQASRTAEAINAHLFNPETGHYNITESRKIGFQQETHAWLITENIAPTSLHSDLISKFQTLTSYDTDSQASKISPTPTPTPKAPLSFSPETPNITPVISPIMSTFHLLALLSTQENQNRKEASQTLHSVWGPIHDKESEHFTGTTWEFLLKDDGTPFKDQFCSYAQLFSVGPTFIFSRYVLGVEPIGAGFREFRE